MAQQKQIRLGTMRLRVLSLASLNGLRIRSCVSCGVGHRRGSDLALLWLWHRPVATALIRPLAWEPPYALGAAVRGQKTRKKKKRREREKKPSFQKCKNGKLTVVLCIADVKLSSPESENFLLVE